MNSNVIVITIIKISEYASGSNFADWSRMVAWNLQMCNQTIVTIPLVRIVLIENVMNEKK